MQQTSYRTEKINQLIWRELVVLLRNHIKDPRVRGVSITEVITSKDLSSSKVFFSCDNDKRDEVLQGLAAAKGFIRSQLAKGVDLRHTPELIFHYDDTMHKAESIERVLHNIKH